MKQIPNLPPFHAKRGCAGCLVQCVLALAFGLVVVAVVCVIVAPWGFYLGGNFHLFAHWEGWGVVHEPEGDYVVRVQIFPRLRGNRGMSLSGPSVNGSGDVCSPHGEMYRGLRLTGGFLNRGIGVHTDGQPFSFSLAERLNFLGTNSQTRLNIGFRGAWHNPDLVMDERGSFRSAFNPDGTMYASDPSKRPSRGEPVPVTFREGSRGDFEAACATAAAAAKKR
jgi:hypothetical protein